MGQRARNSGLLSMMDGPEMRRLAAYMQGRRWLRDGNGHDGGGADDLPPPDDDDATDEDEEEEEDADDDKGKSDEDKSKKDDDTDEDDKPKYSAREYDKLKRRLAASDKKQGELVKQLNALKESKSGELDKVVKAEIDELKPKAAKLVEQNKTMRLQLAFLSTTIKGVVWEDAEAAMKLVDLSDVDIDPDTGAIDKRDLAAAMRRLAKDKPYLVKKAKKDDEDDDEEDKSSGAPMNKRRGKSKGPDRAALAKRFPVLQQVQ
jgi:hypothetical protein